MLPDSRLDGKRILIVEDDYLLADDARRALQRLGAVIIGPVSSVDDALRLIATEQVDAAILDIELDGEESFAVANLLVQKGIPLVFASNVNRERIPERFDGYSLIGKPLELRLITEALLGPPH